MFQMHVLHFQLCMSVDPELLSQQIRAQDFIYRGPTCVIRTNEIAICLPCANNNYEHNDLHEQECELSTMEGWMTPNGFQSVAAYILDNQSDKCFILENGQSLFRVLTIFLIHKAECTKCRVDPISCFKFENLHPAEDDIMDYLEDDSDSLDSGIYGDINQNMVYIALESIDQNLS